MKKKFLIVGLSTLVLGMTVALTVGIGTKGLSAKQTRGEDDYWTITILPSDLDTVLEYQGGSEAACHDASVTVKTDQNKNDASVSYVHAFADNFGGVDYMRFYGSDACIYNTTAMNSIEKIEIFAQNSCDLYWGWEDAGDINYYGYKQGIGGSLSGSEQTFNGDKPNFFKIKNNNAGLFTLKKLVIYLNKSCTPSTNPYVVDSGIKYKKYGVDAYQAAGFAGAPMASVVIKDQINGLPVTKIADSAFRGQTAITSLTLPSTLTFIDRYAFYECSNIEAVEIPKSVENIYFLAFGDMYNCTSLTFEAGGTTGLSIGQAAFRGIGHQGVLTLPSRVTDIGGGGGGYFTGASGITAYALNSDNVSGNCISVDASGVLFATSNGKKELFSYPAGSTATTYTVPADVTSVHTSEGFKQVQNLQVVNFVNENALSLPSYCMSSMPSLTTVNFNGTGVVTFDWYVFSGCNNLRSLVIPANAVCRARGLAEVGTSTKHANIYLKSSSLPAGFDSSWDYGDSENGYVSVYFYSESEPATLEEKAQSWHYVEGVATPWAVNIEFRCYRTDIGEGYALYVLGDFNSWTADEASRGTYSDGCWKVNIIAAPNVAYEFKGAISTWDNPSSPVYEAGSNHSWTPDNYSFEYVLNWQYE